MVLNHKQECTNIFLYYCRNFCRHFWWCIQVWDFNSEKEKIQQSFLMMFTCLVLAFVYYVKLNSSFYYVKEFILLNSYGLHHSYVSLSGWLAVWLCKYFWTMCLQKWLSFKLCLPCLHCVRARERMFSRYKKCFKLHSCK